MFRCLIFSITLGCSACASPPSQLFANGISYELVSTSAESEQALPMVIALHHMGGSPSTSRKDYAVLDAPARVLLLAGPYVIEGGYSWFPDGYYDLSATAQVPIDYEAGAALAEFIEEVSQLYNTEGRPIATGYSQGGDLAHVLAIRHRETISSIIPMGARFNDAWTKEITASSTQLPVVVLFHGEADETVSIKHAGKAQAYYDSRGYSVMTEAFPDVAHAYPVQMQNKYKDVVEKLLKSEASSL